MSDHEAPDLAALRARIPEIHLRSMGLARWYVEKLDDGIGPQATALYDQTLMAFRDDLGDMGLGPEELPAFGLGLLVGLAVTTDPDLDPSDPELMLMASIRVVAVELGIDPINPHDPRSPE